MPVLRLSVDNIDALPYFGTTTNHQCIYWDDALPAFGLRVYASGRRTFVCSYRLERRKQIASLGRADLLTLEQAREKARAVVTKASVHERSQRALGRLQSKRTVADLCSAFVEQHAKKKRSKWRDDASCLKRRLLPALRSRLAASIVSADIEPIHAEIGGQFLYAANRFHEIVRKMFNWGKVAGLLPMDHRNPTLGIVRFPERKRRRYITTAEMPRFIRALEQEENDTVRHGLWLLLLLGLRSSELLNGKWADIDWDMGTLFVGLTKNGEPLLAPLSEAAIARLKITPRITGNPHIICGRKQGQHLRSLDHALKRVLGRAELVNIRIHDLRRTVGSWLAQDGKSLHLIGDVLNHRDLKTTAGYAYFQTDQRRAALTDHGNRVLSYADVGLNLLRKPQLSSADILLAPTTTPTRPRHYFRRETLYELVWSAPLSALSKQLGVSDGGLQSCAVAPQFLCQAEVTGLELNQASTFPERNSRRLRTGFLNYSGCEGVRGTSRRQYQRRLKHSTKPARTHLKARLFTRR